MLSFHKSTRGLLRLFRLEACLLDRLLDIGLRCLRVLVDNCGGSLLQVEIHGLDAFGCVSAFLMTTVQAAQSIAGTFISAVASLPAAVPAANPSPTIVAISFTLFSLSKSLSPIYLRFASSHSATAPE